MSAHRQPWHRLATRRRAALATSVVAALAVVAPIAEAGAATPHAVPVRAIASPAAQPQARSFVDHAVGDGTLATGPTIIGSVFNGGTVVVTSPGPAVGTVTGSP